MTLLWSSIVGDVNFPGLNPAPSGGQAKIDETPIGQTAPAAGAFTDMTAGAIIGGQVYNTDAQTATIVLTAGDVSGASIEVVLGLTGAITTAENAQLPTVAALVAAIPDAVAGQTYKLRVINVGGTSSGAFTLTTNTGWTLHGTMSVAIDTWRDFIVTLTSLTAATLQSVGTGTNS